MSRAMFLMACVVGLLPAVIRGQDVESGPDKDKPVPPLTVFAGPGDHAGKEVDYTAERGKKPTVYLFIQADKWERPMGRFVRTLDEALGKQGGDAAIVAVWVGGDVEKNKAYLPIAHTAMKLQVTSLAAFTANSLGPNEWGLNPDAFLTAVVAGQGNVAAKFGYRSLNETDAPAVAAALKKAADARPK